MRIDCFGHLDGQHSRRQFVIEPIVRHLLACLILIVPCFAEAQLSRWQLGNPSLIIDLPGDPSGGGVTWHDGPSIFPTSWSAESEDVRVEVAEAYSSGGTDVLATQLAAKLQGELSDRRPTTVSGQPAVRFSVGQAQALVVSDEGRSWIVVLRPKTSEGLGLTAQIFQSIVLERWGTPRWVRRNLGGSRLNAELPFEPAATWDFDSVSRQKYESHFSDFGVEASVTSPSEGSKFDLDKTVVSNIDSEKKLPGTSEFSSETTRLERGDLKGYVVTIRLKRGTKSYVMTNFFGLDNGRLVRVILSGRKENAEHEAWADRIINSLRLSAVNFANFSPRQVGTEGVWFDAPAEFQLDKEEERLKRFGLDFMGFGCDVRVQTLLDGVTQDIDQFMAIEEAALTPRGDVRDLSTETLSRFVDGVEARILRMKYKSPGRSDLDHRAAIVLFLPDRTVVAELISTEGQLGYLDRLIDTARIELPVPAGWTRQQVGSSGLTFLFGKTGEKPEQASRLGGEAVSRSFVDDDIFVEVVELTYSGAAPSAPILATQLFADLKATIKREGRITAQRSTVVGSRTGVAWTLEFDHPTAGKVPIDMIVVRKGDTAVAIVVLPTTRSTATSIKRAVVLNSLK